MSASAAGLLSARTAVVTGGASGIGAAVASRLAEGGAKVLILDLDESAAAEQAAAIGADHRALDLADSAAVAELGLDADILVNCAGIQHVAAIEDFEPERFELIHRLMLLAPFWLTRQVLPGMYGRGWGRVVHVSSVHGHRASAYKSAYVSAKHGLEGLSKVIALEGADKGVTSNTVCPGYVRTPLVEGQIADQATGARDPRDGGRRRRPARPDGAEATRRARGGRRDGGLPLRPGVRLRDRLRLPHGRRLDRRLMHRTPKGTSA